MGVGQEDLPEEGTCELNREGQVGGWGKGTTGRTDIMYCIIYVYLAPIMCHALL